MMQHLVAFPTLMFNVIKKQHFPVWQCEASGIVSYSSMCAKAFQVQNKGKMGIG